MCARAYSLTICTFLSLGMVLAKVPTFTKDVAPILQEHCQVCHRPGEAGPFSMLTYEQTRPWAAAIKQAIRTKKMPPWFADPHYGKFSNANFLTAGEIETISAWVDGQAPKGLPADMPPSRNFFEGWQIGKPDLVYQLTEPYDVPASGVVDYQHIIVPSGFTKDTWVQAAEVRPTDRSVVHHIIAFVREPKSNWFKGQKAGVFFVAPQVKTDEEPDTSALPSDFLVGYAPGQPAEILVPGQAKLIKAGSDFVFQVHYTPNGKAVRDQTRLGIVLANAPPKERVLTLSATNGTFKIPPGDSNYRVDASFEINTPVKLSGLHPHMHGRGKDFEYRIVYPNGEKQVLLSVPHFNWHWQNWYTFERPVDVPKGAKIECVAHFDNSPNNPDNADPTKTVTWGEQSWDEMMVGFFNLVFDAGLPVQNLFAEKKPKAEIAGNRREKVLAIGEEKGYRHEAVTHALTTIERLGRESGLWDTTIRTDTEALTKKKLEYNAKNLNDFDALIFYTGGTLEMDDAQKADFLSFVHDDGKGFVGIHSAAITFTKWPEYGELIGGYYDEHPWGTFEAPVVVEDAGFQGMSQWPREFSIRDEIYQMKDFSREKCHVLMRLDASKLNLDNPRVHRDDRDFAVTWTKTYGKGRVYYSTLGHVEENWDNPAFQKMWVEAIKWALRIAD